MDLLAQKENQVRLEQAEATAAQNRHEDYLQQLAQKKANGIALGPDENAYIHKSRLEDVAKAVKIVSEAEEAGDLHAKSRGSRRIGKFYSRMMQSEDADRAAEELRREAFDRTIRSFYSGHSAVGNLVDEREKRHMKKFEHPNQQRIAGHMALIRGLQIALAHIKKDLDAANSSLQAFPVRPSPPPFSFTANKDEVAKAHGLAVQKYRSEVLNRQHAELYIDLMTEEFAQIAAELDAAEQEHERLVAEIGGDNLFNPAPIGGGWGRPRPAA